MLEDMLSDNARFLDSLKATIKQRQSLITTHITAVNELTEKREEADKLRLRGERKAGAAREEADQAAKAEADAKHQLDEASSLFQQELRRFDTAQAVDFKRTLRRFVRSRITAHRAAAELWAAALPDVDAIPSNPALAGTCCALSFSSS